MAADDLLHDLDDAQRRAVTSPARPLAILAPAGSGKTRVLTRRIAWRVESGDADASHVLALTFTRKAAGELRDRLRALGLRHGVAAGTFHGVAFAQLRSRWADEGRPPPTLLTRKARVLGSVVTGTPLSVAQLAGEIEWAKARLVGPDGYAEAASGARRRTPAPAARIADLYRAYEEEKRRARMVDFDDLLRLCTHLLDTDPSFAAAQRWRFQHLFVDEFQDVNPLQLALLEAWRGTSYDLCVVGDPHQAIYGWNGADASFLEGFRRLHPSAEVIALEGNYRSTPQILGAASEVLRGAGVSDRSVRAARLDGPPVRLERHATDRDEAVAIARAIRDRRGPRAPWSAQAVLVRTHAQIGLVTEALRASGIPHRVRGGDTLLDRREVRDALDLLKRSRGPLAASLPDLEALAAEAPVGGGAPAPDGSGDAGHGDGGDDGAAATRANLELLVQLAQDHLRLDPGSTSVGFVSWLVATLQSEGVDHRRDAVTIATFHAAKGLEWPVVHLAGLEDGLVPISHARNHAQRAEEARLLYVAMTRAEDELRCTWAAQRTFGGKPSERRLTPWLTGLADRQRTRPSEPTGPPADWRARLAEQRAQLAAASSTPSPTLAALHAWRDESARAARVEPAALIDDRLLEMIAERRPTSHDELTAIPGMGRVLAARVGDGLLAALRHPVGDLS
ncbi:MAG: ATP-dependent DNA helicase UvrD2 [Acidimicrobiales bacterium]|nr:ATP-dependent DNA helicase UvrD2 [Acidimicrobiales bacterium]